MTNIIFRMANRDQFCKVTSPVKDQQHTLILGVGDL